MMNPESGVITGKNCHDEEKVKRFYQAFPNGKVESFYSDSRSDTPMAKIAQQAFIVKKDIIRPWDDK